MTQQQKKNPFGIGLILGAIAGGLAAFFLSPKSGKENREMVSKKVKEIEKMLKEAETDIRAKVKKIYGETSEELVGFHKETMDKISAAVDDLKGKLEQIDFKRYQDIAEGAIEEAKKNTGITAKQIDQLRDYLKEDWEKIKEKKA